MYEGVSSMAKFCTSCGAALQEGAKFCIKCGAAVLTAPVETVSTAPVETALTAPVEAVSTSHVEAEGAAKEISQTNETLPQEKKSSLQNLLGSKAPEQIKSKITKETKDFARKILSEAGPSYGTAGEIALPQELTPFPEIAQGDGLFSVLKGGISGLLNGFKRVFGDKKRLVLVIALVITWLLVNLLASLGIFPLPVRFLSWLTAAQGSLIGGSIGKGLVAALLAQLIADQGMLQTVKSGLGQLGGIAKGLRGVAGPLLMGIAVALIVTNLMVSSNLQNTMVCIAAFLLSAKALTHHGFLRKFINALLPKAKDTTLTTLMRGWTLGFALFAAVSFLPGGGNGYVLGILLLLAGGIVTVVGRNKKEATAE
jgi:hypothetical protein